MLSMFFILFLFFLFLSFLPFLLSLLLFSQDFKRLFNGHFFVTRFFYKLWLLESFKVRLVIITRVDKVVPCSVGGRVQAVLQHHLVHAGKALVLCVALPTAPGAHRVDNSPQLDWLEPATRPTTRIPTARSTFHNLCVPWI